MLRKQIYCVSLLLAFPVMLYSQMRSVEQNTGANYVGLSVEYGVTSFHGDIDEGPAPGNLLKNNQAFKIQLSRNFNSLFEAGGRIVFGGMSGEKIREIGRAHV